MYRPSVPWVLVNDVAKSLSYHKKRRVSSYMTGGLNPNSPELRVLITLMKFGAYKIIFQLKQLAQMQGGNYLKSEILRLILRRSLARSIQLPSLLLTLCNIPNTKSVNMEHVQHWLMGVLKTWATKCLLYNPFLYSYPYFPYYLLRNSWGLEFSTLPLGG